MNKAFTLDRRYKAVTSLKMGGREIKRRVVVTVRHGWSDGSADGTDETGLPFRIPSEVITRAGLYPVSQGSRLVIETGDGDAADTATSVARA